MLDISERRQPLNPSMNLNFWIDFGLKIGIRIWIFVTTRQTIPSTHFVAKTLKFMTPGPIANAIYLWLT